MRTAGSVLLCLLDALLSRFVAEYPDGFDGFVGDDPCAVPVGAPDLTRSRRRTPEGRRQAGSREDSGTMFALAFFTTVKFVPVFLDGFD